MAGRVRRSTLFTRRRVSRPVAGRAAGLQRARTTRTADGWEAGGLPARTTQMQVGFIRKTGVPLSDQATIDWRFFRHDNVLTVLMVARGPIYLVEPEHRPEGVPRSET